MKTITIKVPDFLNAKLDAAAAAMKQSKSGVVRDLLLNALPPAEKSKTRKAAKPSLHDRLKKYQDAGAAGVPDLASNPKHLAGYGR